MASTGFDTSELARLARQMGQAGEDLRRQVKPFLRKEGTKLKSLTAREARKVGKKTGKYR